jgi:hypothetical protein
MNIVSRISFTLLVLGYFNCQAQIERKIDNYLNEIHQNHTIPGFAAVVVKEIQIIYKSGFGK